MKNMFILQLLCFTPGILTKLLSHFTIIVIYTCTLYIMFIDKLKPVFLYRTILYDYFSFTLPIFYI